VVIKTHALDACRYTHVIHLVRNPFDAISSYFHWKQDVAQQAVSWEEHVDRAVSEWRLHTEYWLAARKPVLRIKYENLLQDPEKALGSVLRWLDLDVPDHKIGEAVSNAGLENMRALTPQLGEKFFREGRSGAGLDHFTESHRRAITASLSDLFNALEYTGTEETQTRS
jgi:hypothetical protein